MTDDNSVAGGQQNNSYGAALTQDSIDVYWCIYKNIEKEVVGLTDVIHFTDDQKQVFSIRIAELIIRTHAEIECLCKDLFATLGVSCNKPILYFDGDCIAEFEKRWGVESKVVKIIHPFIRFSDKELCPFRNATVRTARTNNPNSWKLANNEVKHNLRNRLSSATIEALMNAMAALYLLNVYSRSINKVIKVCNRDTAQNFDETFGSTLFAVKVQKILDAKSIGADKVVLNDFVYCPECTFRIDPTESSLQRIHLLMKSIAGEARAYVEPVVKKMIQTGELKLPPTSGQLDETAISQISLKANMISMNKHVQEFGNAIASISYEAKLTEKPTV